MYTRSLNLSFHFVFISRIENKGWILDKIKNKFQKSAESQGALCTEYNLYGGNKLHVQFPLVDYPVFMHYSNFFHLWSKIKSKVKKVPIIWFTHFEPNYKIQLSDLISICNHASAIILVPCSSNKHLLLENGCRPENVHLILGGYDADLQDVVFEKNKNSVAFVSACYERKRPGSLITLAQALPDYTFNIIGPSVDEIDNKDLLWSKSKYIEIIKKIKNIQLYEVDYSNYAKLISENQYYLMLSTIEGGPIGLLEALALGCVPIATDTGFVKDILINQFSECIVTQNFNISELINLLTNKSIFHKLNKDTKSLVQNMTWDDFGSEFNKIFLDNNSKTVFNYSLSGDKENTQYREDLKQFASIPFNSDSTKLIDYESKLVNLINSSSNPVLISIAKSRLRMLNLS